MTYSLHYLVVGLLIVAFTNIAIANIINAMPIGTIDFIMSSLRPYLLERERPIKLPTVLTLERNIMLYKRSECDSPAKPASFMTAGP